MPSTKNGHLACPPSRRGHDWSDAPSSLELRVCDRCGAIGRVSKQGVIVATGDYLHREAVS